MDLCQRCEAELSGKPNPFLRCPDCGFENDDGGYDFDCGSASQAECDCCEERMCRHAGAALG